MESFIENWENTSIKEQKDKTIYDLIEAINKDWKINLSDFEDVKILFEKLNNEKNEVFIKTKFELNNILKNSLEQWFVIESHRDRELLIFTLNKLGYKIDESKLLDAKLVKLNWDKLNLYWYTDISTYFSQIQYRWWFIDKDSFEKSYYDSKEKDKTYDQIWSIDINTWVFLWWNYYTKIDKDNSNYNEIDLSWISYELESSWLNAKSADIVDEITTDDNESIVTDDESYSGAPLPKAAHQLVEDKSSVTSQTPVITTPVEIKSSDSTNKTPIEQKTSNETQDFSLDKKAIWYLNWKIDNKNIVLKYFNSNEVNSELISKIKVFQKENWLVDDWLAWSKTILKMKELNPKLINNNDSQLNNWEKIDEKFIGISNLSKEIDGMSREDLLLRYELDSSFRDLILNSRDNYRSFYLKTNNTASKENNISFEELDVNKKSVEEIVKDLEQSGITLTKIKGLNNVYELDLVGLFDKSYLTINQDWTMNFKTSKFLVNWEQKNFNLKDAQDLKTILKEINALTIEKNKLNSINTRKNSQEISNLKNIEKIENNISSLIQTLSSK